MSLKDMRSSWRVSLARIFHMDPSRSSCKLRQNQYEISGLDPLFLFVLRILLFIAVIQVMAAGFIIGPQWVKSTAGHLAKKVKLQEPLSLTSKVDAITTAKNEIMNEVVVDPLKSAKTTNIQKGPDSSQAALLETENVSKTVSSSVEGGLQAGESLAIISIQHLPGAEGEQILKIAMKARSYEVISVPEVKVQVYFYDHVAGEVVASKSPVTSRWLNAAVDWKNGEPQLLQVTYQPDNNNPDAHYLGYIVAVYYKGELQACRADPPTITNQFPIRVYIGRDDF